MADEKQTKAEQPAKKEEAAAPAAPNLGGIEPVTASPVTPKKGKKRVKKNVATGVVYINATFNNTMITITDATGNVLSWSSAGARGFKGSLFIHSKDNEADLVILDMILEGGMDGLETYQKILKLYPNQKAILVRGYAETKQVQEAQRLGAGDYVRKPFVLEKIGEVVRKELDKKAPAAPSP